MLAPNKQKAIYFGGRCYREGDPEYAFFSLPPKRRRSKAVVLADVPLDRPARDRLNTALQLLDPLPAEREKWRSKIHTALVVFPADDDLKRDDELFEIKDRAGFKRYVAALRKLQAAHAALDPSIQPQLPLSASDIASSLAEAKDRLKFAERWRPRARGRKRDKRAREAVGLARLVLGLCGLELTTERGGKWHRLSQLFADSKRDLRHHLKASLVERPTIPLAEKS